MSLIKWKWQHYPGRKCCLSFLRQCLVQGGQLRPVCRALLRTDGVCRCLCWGPGVLPDSTGAWQTWGPGCVPCELRDEHRPLHSAQLLQKASPAPTGSTEVGVGSSSSSLQEVEDEKVCSPSAFVFCLLVAISSLALAGGRMVFSALEGDQYSQHMGVWPCTMPMQPQWWKRVWKKWWNQTYKSPSSSSPYVCVSTGDDWWFCLVL